MSIDLERLRADLQTSKNLNFQLAALGLANTIPNRNWVIQALLQDPNNPTWLQSTKDELATLSLIQVVMLLLGNEATPDIIEDIVYFGNRTYPVGTQAILQTRPDIYQLIKSLDLGIQESDPLSLPSNTSINQQPLIWTLDQLINDDFEMKIQSRIADIFGGPLNFNQYSYHIFVHQALLEILEQLLSSLAVDELLIANQASSLEQLMEKYSDPLLWPTLVYPYEIQERIRSIDWIDRWFEYNPLQVI